MRHWFLSLVAMAILVLALTFPAGAPAAPPAHNGQPAAAPAFHANATPTPEPHPEIRAAIESLRHAREHLEHAAHDFGGHRVDAIRSIDEAIHQLQVCLEYDK
jgi:hypothetical protein